MMPAEIRSRYDAATKFFDDSLPFFQRAMSGDDRVRDIMMIHAYLWAAAECLGNEGVEDLRLRYPDFNAKIQEIHDRCIAEKKRLDDIENDVPDNVIHHDFRKSAASGIAQNSKKSQKGLDGNSSPR